MRASVRKPAGTLLTIPDDGSPVTQTDTVQCVHCGRHWVWSKAVLKAVNKELGFCQRCNGITCGKKCQKCVPQEAQLENMEHGREVEHRPIVVGGFHNLRLDDK